MREKLKNEIASCTWQDLVAEAARGRLVVVDAYLDLLDVAVAVAEDKTAVVAGWMEQGQLVRLSDEQMKAWQSSPQKPFQMVVLAPYVFIQEILAS